MEGITGVNISQATSDLNSFKGATDNIVNKLAQAVNTFCSDIVHNWTSPNAVSFGREFDYKLIDLYIDPQKAFDAILQDAAMAVEKIASSNGASFNGSAYYINHPYTMYYGNGALTDVLDVSPNGEVGMNVNAVKASLGTFTEAVNSALSLMDSLPTSIALYDPSGSLKATYNTRIKNAIASATEIVNSITNSVNTYMATETNTVVTGVQIAVDAMTS